MMRGIAIAAVGAFLALVSAFVGAFLTVDPVAWPWLAAGFPIATLAVGLIVLFAPATWHTQTGDHHHA